MLKAGCVGVGRSLDDVVRRDLRGRVSAGRIRPVATPVRALELGRERPGKKSLHLRRCDVRDLRRACREAKIGLEGRVDRCLCARRGLGVIVVERRSLSVLAAEHIAASGGCVGVRDQLLQIGLAERLQAQRRARRRRGLRQTLRRRLRRGED